MDLHACAALMVLAGVSAGPADDAAVAVPDAAAIAVATEDAETVTAPRPGARAVDAADVSFRFLAREEGHEILLSEVHVTIVHPVQGKVLDAVSDGPFLVARVPPGRYQVAASHEGRTRHVLLNVARSEPRSVAVYW
jgi:hypothetical protein